MGGHAKTYIALASVGVMVVNTAGIAFAQQETQGARSAKLTLGQTLRYSDNLDFLATGNAGAESRTKLDFAFSSATRTQSLSFNLGGAMVVNKLDDVKFDAPYARFSYAIEGANSRLSLDARYRRKDLDSTVQRLVVPLDPVTGTPLAPVTRTARIERGIRSNSDVALKYQTGLRSNVGFKLNLSHSARRYSNTGSTGLFNSATQRAETEVTFRINPQMTARLMASQLRYEAQDTGNTNRRETRAGLGLSLKASPTLSIDTSLRHSRFTRTRSGVTSTVDGLNFGLGATRTLRNGTLSLNLSSNPGFAGRQSLLRMNRVMGLRREGRLSYGIGLSKTAGFSAEPLFALSYLQPFKRGNLDLSFSQQARTDENDDEPVILTRFSARYKGGLTNTVNWSVGAAVNDVDAQSATGQDRRQLIIDTTLSGPLNAISSWSAGLNFSDTDSSSPSSTANQRRFGLSLSYRRQMNRDWDLIASMRHDAIRESSAANRKANTISVGIEKTFSFRP